MIKEFSIPQLEDRNPFEFEVYNYLQNRGLKIPPFHVFISLEELLHGLDMFSEVEKYVVKAISPKIIHKSDVGAVVLNATKSRLSEIYTEMSEKFSHLDFKGVMITYQATSGIDFIVGTSIDQTFGKIMVFGIGGIFVEVMRDVTFAKPPITRSEALMMIKSLKYQNILQGVRGLPKVQFKDVEDFLMKFSEIISKDKDSIKELEINPFRYTSEGIVPLDARAVLYLN